MIPCPRTATATTPRIAARACALPTRKDVQRTRVGRGPFLVETRTLSTSTGDTLPLAAFARSLRARAQSHPGYLGEVHFADEGDRIRILALWRSPTDLRSFVEEAHRDVLAFREDSGVFPQVERALWWSTAGTGVTPAEAAERAARLREHGPSARAFTLRSPVPAPAPAPL